MNSVGVMWSNVFKKTSLSGNVFIYLVFTVLVQVKDFGSLGSIQKRYGNSAFFSYRSLCFYFLMLN